MHSPRNIRFVSATLFSLIFATATASAATEYLLITTDALAASFQPLVDARSQQGLQSQLLTVEDIQAAATPGRDLPEQIRNAIADVHAGGSLRFVLLGGDSALIPPRFAADLFYPTDPELPTDLYFAALDGDWDADGDGIFGEAEDDAPDLDPELAIGRAPVQDAAQAAQFVAKIATYESPANVGHLGSALLLDEVLFPAQWQQGQPIQLDAAEFGEAILTYLQAAPAPLSDARLYENYFDYPGSSVLTTQSALSAMSAGGSGWVVFGGHASAAELSLGDGTVDAADAMTLANAARLFVFVSMGPYGTAFDGDTVLEALLRNPNGGAVASVGFSRTTFPLPAQDYIEALHEALFVDDLPTLGEAMQSLLSEKSGAAALSPGQRFTHLSFNLLGDPAIGVASNATVTATPPALAGQLLVHPVLPNPFNPSTMIRFDLGSSAQNSVTVEVAIFDLAGRRLRTLLNGELSGGPHSLRWNGRDDAGQTLPSGAYFASVRAFGQRRAVKMVLLK